MTKNEAIAFLVAHQPLPPTCIMEEEVLRTFDEVRKLFTSEPDDRCVPLLLNAFGEGDGHGVYQLVEDAVLAHPESVVVPALVAALRSEHASVRYWSAQIAANYKSRELTDALAELAKRGGRPDER